MKDLVDGGGGWTVEGTTAAATTPSGFGDLDAPFCCSSRVTTLTVRIGRMKSNTRCDGRKTSSGPCRRRRRTRFPPPPAGQASRPAGVTASAIAVTMASICSCERSGQRRLGLACAARASARRFRNFTCLRRRRWPRSSSRPCLWKSWRGRTIRTRTPLRSHRCPARRRWSARSTPR